jgi:hypothetical protein
MTSMGKLVTIVKQSTISHNKMILTIIKHTQTHTHTHTHTYHSHDKAGDRCADVLEVQRATQAPYSPDLDPRDFTHSP